VSAEIHIFLRWLADENMTRNITYRDQLSRVATSNTVVRLIDRIAQAAEMRATGLKLLDDGEQMADRAGEAVKPDHDQGFAGGDVAQQACQHRPLAINTGSVLFEYCGTAGCTQFIALRIGALVLGSATGHVGNTLDRAHG